MARPKKTPDVFENTVTDTFTEEVIGGPPPVPLKFKRLDPRAVLPKFATPDSACFDLCAIEDFRLSSRIEHMGHGRAFKTGWAVEVPVGFVLKIYSRSGMGFKNGVRLGNCVGVIDSDYRGELQVKLQNDGVSEYVVRAGDRIAQGMLEYVYPTTIEEVAELSETERGTGGLGSTGR